MEQVIREYYDGCNEADAEKIIACFEPDGVHYFPAGARQGRLISAEGIAAGWRRSVERLGSQWTIDRLLLDEQTREATIEWTHWRTKAGTRLRGAELCRFSDQARITEIRAYYAAPAPDLDQNYELGEFDYAGRDYPLEPPAFPVQHRSGREPRKHITTPKHGAS